MFCFRSGSRGIGTILTNAFCGGSWVTLARRRALDRLRRRVAYCRVTEGLKNEIDNPLINEITTTTRDLENSNLSLLLGRVIQPLPEAQKEVIHPTFLNRFSERESRGNVEFGWER